MHEAADNTAAQVRRHRPDYWLVVLALILVTIGLTVVYAIGPALSATQGGGSGTYYVSRQLIAVALSIIAFIVCARIPLKVWQKWQMPLLIIGIIGTVIALITPVNLAYPAHRWIRAGGLSLQSVEVLKFALLFWLATFFANRYKDGTLGDTKRTLYPLLALVCVVGVIIGGAQSDFGSTVVIIAMAAIMAFLTGMPVKRLMPFVGLLVLGAIILVAIAPYRLERLTTFMHPDANCLSTGYQECQALIAVGSGGIDGLGLGRSVQAYGYLPEAQDDSIFAIYAEKFGFVGSVLLLVLFVALFARLRTIMERAPDTFSRLIVAGILAWLSAQTIINVGAMIGLLPLKGITLPFISYGGTSVLFVGGALGLVFQISRYTTFNTRDVKRNGQKRIDHEDSSNRRRLGRAYHPDLGSRA
ncbi:MAG TPA: putative peptidoglycan glycosyltransferase FtsW [Verrucomicrobiae bacterium]|nr:putative peptidoglycan glycosyltransferase FtsW [Verrucomicrobiae bacterium]